MCVFVCVCVCMREVCVRSVSVCMHVGVCVCVDFSLFEGLVRLKPFTSIKTKIFKVFLSCIAVLECVPELKMNHCTKSIFSSNSLEPKQH